MNFSLKSKLISAVALVIMISPTLALAGKRNRDYREVCEEPTNLSDHQKSYCAAAKMSMHTKDGETAKAVAFLAGSVATFALGVTSPASGGSNEVICKSISYGLTAAGVATDAYVGSKNDKVMETLEHSLGGVAKAFMGLAAVKAIPKVAKKFDSWTKPNDAGEANKAGEAKAACYSATFVLGVQSVLSGAGAITARTAFDKSLDSAKIIGDSRGGQLPTNNFSVPQNGGRGPGPGENGKYATRPESKTELCGDASNYTDCLKHTVPEIAAITNSPELMGAINKRLNGQSLGDLIKNYDSDKSSPEAYVGAAMGIPSSAMGEFAGHLATAAKNSGALDKYSPLTYSSAGPKPASVAPDMDFSKMMNDMLKQMNPDGTSKVKDPSELVFRQLDLLPADKIEARSDISLFARIGYRYRKKASDVDQLNYASPANQAFSDQAVPGSRTPAQSK